MKKRFSFLLSLFIFLLILVGCNFDSNGNSEDNSKIPTYIGMQILNEDNRNTNRINTSNNLAINGKEKKEEDDEYYYWLFVHVYGYWGWSGRRPGEGNNEEHLPEDYNQENDYNYDIENEVKIDVLTDDEVKYFVRQNEDFILQVKLSNPENYEIQSFTLNGKKYSNYMFEYGSDMENLYLKVKAPEVSGYTEYTIDAIKYIDGENIKDVDLSTGEKTIKAGVQYDIEPEATISNVSHTTTGFDANVKIEDRYNLLENNPVKFFVYDGTNIVYEKELVVGDNVLHASNLLMNYKYEYAVVGVYDPLDGQWNKPRCLLKGEINTDNAYELKDVVANKEGVSFDFTCNDNNAQISYIAVYDKDSNNTLVKSIEDLTTRTIDGLLSNHNYILYAEYTYTINEKEYINYIYKDFDTLAKKAASLILKEVTATQTTLTFDYDIVDTDNILTIESISLYNAKNELVKSLDDLTSKEFTELLSNTTYEIRLVYKYDLNDGNGEQSQLVRKEEKTVAKSVPTLTIKDVESTKTTITFDYDIVDPDNILTIESISLYNTKNELVKSLDDLALKEFTELLSNTTYEIRLVYKYDLNDGNGEQTKLIRKEIKTGAKATPTLKFKDVVSSKTSISFDYEVNDVDNVLEIQVIRLYNVKNEMVKSLDDLTLREFTGLLSDTTYEIRMVCTYDLNDGKGEVNDLIRKEIKTKSKSIPAIRFSSQTVQDNTITYDYEIADEDQILKINHIQLYRNNVFVRELDNEKELKNLDYNYEYSVKILYSYDLNDGAEIIEGSIISYFDLYQFSIYENGTKVADLKDTFKGPELIIPEKVYVNGNETTITSIGGMYSGPSRYIKSLVLPATLIRIEGGFGGCTQLKSISFGENSTLEYIGGGSFVNCPLSETLTIPASVKYIGREAFRNISSKVVLFEEGSQLEEIDSNAFYVCEKLEKVILPSSLEMIGALAFARTALKQIVIPKNTTIIGKKVFELLNITIACEANEESSYWDDEWTDGNAFYLAGMWILDDNGTVQILKGHLELMATDNEIIANVAFDKKIQLEESKTVVTVKLYNENVTSQLNNQAVDLGTEKVEGTVEFEQLTKGTKYVCKLYVSYNGKTYLIDTKDITTLSTGSSEENPISIKTVDEFLKIEDDAESYYRLDADLDFTGKSNVSLFTSSEPFKGNLDGNNKTIKNYKIATGEYCGLFEYLKDATIKDLKLENVFLDLISSCRYVGALAGYAINCDIQNVTVDGFDIATSSASTTSAQIGGLIGCVTSQVDTYDTKSETTIINCSINTLRMNLSQVRPSSSYAYYVGGFVGRAAGQTTITNCYTQGVMDLIFRSNNGKVYVGGFIGGAESEKLISNSYSLVTMSLVKSTNTLGYLACGGFAGDSAQGQANLDNCLVVADIIVLSEAKYKESTSYSVAQQAYIGGVIGKVSYSSDGVKNCYYAKISYGIQVLQADTYKDNCYVSNTIAYVNAATKNKVKDVYTYDNALNVKGMLSTSDADTYVAAEADTTNITVLGDTNKEVLTNAVTLREELKEAYNKFNNNEYYYTNVYAEDTVVDLTSVNLESVELGASATTLTLENNSVTITPTASEVYDVLYMTFKNTKVALTTLVKIGSKTATA